MEQQSPTSRPVRVAIIGGGCAGMTTAFELSRPEHGGRFEVTVFQMGFRLGGKGASGRGVGGRIEEHGLHVWMGFYENAFRLMRACYDELGRDRFRCPIASWRDAFEPAPYVAVTERDADGTWHPWLARFPAGPGLPGDPLDIDNPFTMRGYLAKAAALVVELLRSASGTPGGERPESTSLAERIEWFLRHGQLATVAALAEAMELVRAALGLVPEGGLREAALRLLDAIALAAHKQLAMLTQGDRALRLTFQVVDLVLAVIKGSLVHGLMLGPDGFDVIDRYDWREWLALHGASKEALGSGFMRGIYDLAFAYVEGDPARPSLSAAAALRGAMRMFFTYRGALFWRMRAGMGDVVFAPLYELLQRRGVRFSFFHRLRELEVGEDGGPHVRALHFDVQARCHREPYQPLIDVHGLPCWPAEPDYAQLIEGEQLRVVELESPSERRIAGERTLTVGQDFDLVVLALGGGAVPGVARQLIARSASWQAMERGLATVATQAFQLWLREDMRSLGYPHPAGNLSGWVEPFDTWADMTHLIPAEASHADVKAVAYFCSPLPDGPGDERAQRAQVHDNAVRFMNRELAALWPHAADAEGFRWELLAVEPGQPAAPGPARFASQFWTANVRPSERYTLSLPGSQRDRLSPLDMSFDNLTVAGDWTASGLNTGCVESAVMSGRLAAHALSGLPAMHEIIGYDHP